MDSLTKNKIRQRRKTVLIVGEGEREKIFIRHLVSLYCRRDSVSVSSSSAGGCNPDHILDYTIKFRRGFKRDIELILLDTDKEWSDEMKDRAKNENIELIGNSPCLESFFLELLSLPGVCEGVGSGRCKTFFEDKCSGGRFNEDECVKLFPKSLLNSARKTIPKLNRIIQIIEGNF